MRMAILASGNGSNFQVLAEKVQTGEIPGEVVLLFSDQPQAFVLQRAAELGIHAETFSPKEFETKKEYEEKLLAILAKYQVDLVVLAGYMRIIGSGLLSAYPQKIINIHPSLLPAFPGLHGIKDAFEAGVSETGVTVHYIDSGVDTGPIIAQARVSIEATDTLASLEEKVHQVEHQLYPRVIKEIVENNQRERKEQYEKTRIN